MNTPHPPPPGPTPWGGRRAQRLRALVRATYGETCILCGQFIPPDGAPIVTRDPGLKLSVAHVIARAHGGSNALPNLRPAHLRCNQDAGTTSVPVAEDGTAFFRNAAALSERECPHSLPGSHENAPETAMTDTHSEKKTP